MNEKDKENALQRLEAMEKVLPSSGRVWVIPHDYPDPDALASAAGLHLLLSKRFGLRPRIGYTGMVSRPENREMLKSIPYKHTRTSAFRAGRKPIPAIYVDTGPWAGNVTLPPTEAHTVVFDHHPPPRKAKNQAEFCVIEPDVGATATMIYELLRAAEIPPPKWLATTMVYAISTETLDMLREAHRRDLHAYSELIGEANLSALGRIRHAPLSRIYFKFLQEAMTLARVYGRINWTILTNVDRPEIVAELADLLLRMERITWSFCIGRRKNQMIVSLRSCQSGAKCGKVLKSAVGRRGSAGGHHSMAAGFLEIKNPDAWRDEAEGFIRRLIQKIEAGRDPQEMDLEEAGQPLVQHMTAPEDAEPE